MFTLKSLAVAGTLVLGAIATSTATASAGNLNVGVSIHTPGLNVHYRGGGYKRFRHYHGPRYGRWYRPAPVRVCTPGKAVRKARANGVRRAHVHRIGRRGVVIAGKKRGHRVLMGFGKSRYCPVRFVARR